MDEKLVDPTYLPFSVGQLRNHLTERRPDYYLKSAERYRDFLKEHPDRRGLPLGDMRQPCQIEKDERFWVASCLMMDEYRTQPEALRRDLPHRQDTELRGVSCRIGWLTWEDCQCVLPEACPWLAC